MRLCATWAVGAIGCVVAVTVVVGAVTTENGQPPATQAPATTPSAPVVAGGQTDKAALTPLKDADSLAKGKALFENPASLCVACHKPDLGGLVGPNLTDSFSIHGCAFPDIVTSIRTGFLDKGMLPFGSGKPLTDEELRQVASYIVSKHDSNPPAAKAIDPAREKPCK